MDSVLSEQLISVSLALLNLLLGLLMVIYSIINRVYMQRRVTGYLTGLLGLYFAGIYAHVVLQNLGIIPPADPIRFSRVFIRPAFSLTLCVLLLYQMRYRINGKRGGNHR
jgi:hypothetical protein